MKRIAGIAEIVLNVRDLDASLGFYRDAVGLPVLGAPGPVFLQVGPDRVGVPQMLVLVPMPTGTPEFDAPRTLHHLALEVAPEDFVDFEDHLRTHGFVPRRGTHPVVPSRTMYIDDPDGNEVEVICLGE